MNLDNHKWIPEAWPKVMIDGWQKALPEGFELFWSPKANGYAFRRVGTKHPSVEINDDGQLIYRGKARKPGKTWWEDDVYDAITYVWPSYVWSDEDLRRWAIEDEPQ